jgi:hypothetical protein
LNCRSLAGSSEEYQDIETRPQLLEGLSLRSLEIERIGDLLAYLQTPDAE